MLFFLLVQWLSHLQKTAVQFHCNVTAKWKDYDDSPEIRWLHTNKNVALFSEASGKELQGGEMSRYKDALCSNQLEFWAHHTDERRANLCYSVNADLSDTMAM